MGQADIWSKIFQTIRSFGERIYNDKIEIHETSQEQANLSDYSLNFNSKTKPRSDEDKMKKVFLIVQKVSIRVKT